MKGLQFAGILRRGENFDGDSASEKAAAAWRQEAEARAAQVKRQDEEVARLTGLVTELSARLDKAILEIGSLKMQRDELLGRPDYGALLERFHLVEETTGETLTLLKAHDQLTLTRLGEIPPPEVIEKIDQIASAVIPPAVISDD